jgi:hypothetical protein
VATAYGAPKNSAMAISKSVTVEKFMALIYAIVSISIDK